MVQFLSNFFLGFLPFLLGFSKVPVFCVTLYFPVTYSHIFQVLSPLQVFRLKFLCLSNIYHAFSKKCPPAYVFIHTLYLRAATHLALSCSIVNLRAPASCIQDRLFPTLQRTLFIYLINKYISLSDICLTVHH